MRAGRGRPRQGGRRGLRAKFQGELCACGRPELGERPGLVASRGPCRPSCVSSRPTGPRRPAPPPRARTCRGRWPPGRPMSSPGGRSAAWPLFCSSPPGFRLSLGRLCGRKPPPRTLLESLNGKGAHLLRPGAARLIFAICLHMLLQKKKKTCLFRGVVEPGGVACPLQNLSAGRCQVSRSFTCCPALPCLL